MNAGKAANRIMELEEALSAKDAELAALRGELAAKDKRIAERVAYLERQLHFAGIAPLSDRPAQEPKP